MDLLVSILPAVIAVISIGYVFVTYKGKLGIGIIAGITVVNIALVITTIVFANKLSNNVIVEQEKFTAFEEWKAQHITRLEAFLSKFNPDDRTEEEGIQALVDQGWTLRNSAFSTSFEAAQARIDLIATVARPQQRIEVLGLPDAVNAEKLTLLLEETGYFVRSDTDDENDNSGEGENETKVKKAPMREPNVIFFGHKVSDDDVKMISLTFMQAGIQLRMFKAYKNKTRENANTVELLWKKSYSRRTPTSVKKLLDVGQFRR